MRDREAIALAIQERVMPPPLDLTGIDDTVEREQEIARDLRHRAIIESASSTAARFERCGRSPSSCILCAQCKVDCNDIRNIIISTPSMNEEASLQV